MLKFDQHFSVKNKDPIEFLREIVEKREKLLSVPVYKKGFNMTCNLGGDLFLNI